MNRSGLRRLAVCLALPLLSAFFSPWLALAQITVVSSLSDDRTVAPGTVYSGIIRIMNPTDRSQQARVYPADYLFFADGNNLYESPGFVPRSNASWIEFSPSLLTVPPGETVPIHYTVRVPAVHEAASPSGTYWSVLMVEPIPAGSAASTLQEEEEPRLTMQVVTRYGVQVATHVGTAARPACGFVAAGLVQNEAGAKVLQVDIENTGEAMMRPAAWLELYDASGTPLGKVDGSTYRIYPGTSVRYRYDLSHLVPGTYQALVMLDSGDENLTGAEYTLEL